MSGIQITLEKFFRVTLWSDLDELDGVLVPALHWDRVTRRGHRHGGQGGGLVPRAENGIG